MTDVEKIFHALERVEFHMSGIREDIAALSQDPSKKQTAGSLKEYFGNTMGLIDLYLRIIEKLLDEKLLDEKLLNEKPLNEKPVPMARLEQLAARLDALEAAAKENIREIAELKKLAEP